jgi:hypothetical protein
MKVRSRVFPFAEFDPILRRDLNAVLAAVRHELGTTKTIGERKQTDELAEFLKERARKGERCPLRLYDAAMIEYGRTSWREQRATTFP